MKWFQEFHLEWQLRFMLEFPLHIGNLVKHSLIVTAHSQSKEGKPILDWKSLANGIDTIAFYMGVANLPYICQNLIVNGKPPETRLF